MVYTHNAIHIRDTANVCITLLQETLTTPVKYVNKADFLEQNHNELKFFQYVFVKPVKPAKKFNARI